MWCRETLRAGPWSYVGSQLQEIMVTFFSVPSNCTRSERHRQSRSLGLASTGWCHSGGLELGCICDLGFRPPWQYAANPSGRAISGAGVSRQY